MQSLISIVIDFLSGNGTIIGASANIVAISVARQHGYIITFFQFFK